MKGPFKQKKIIETEKTEPSYKWSDIIKTIAKGTPTGTHATLNPFALATFYGFGKAKDLFWSHKKDTPIETQVLTKQTLPDPWKIGLHKIGDLVKLYEEKQEKKKED
mgnify:CR=1 FL=1